MNCKSIPLLLFLSFAVLTTQAQSSYYTTQDTHSTAYHIKALKEGVLLVRLPSNRKKIAALEKTLDDSLSQKEFANVTKALNRTIKETEELHKGIISGMDSNYTYSNYTFFMDYETKGVMEGKGIVYHSDMVTAFDVSATQVVYVLSVGSTTESPIDAFIVLDSELRRLARPFPGQISRSGFAGIFGNDASHIKRLNKKLWRSFNGLEK